MSQIIMTKIDACVFDAYGTLFDVHSAVGRLRADVGPKADELSQIWRTKQLEYTWLRSLMGEYKDFWQVTGDALDYALASTGISPADGAHPADGARPAAIRDRLMDAYLGLDAYAEVPAMLGRLKAAGLKTAILSNGEPNMLEAAVNAAGLSGLLDEVLSVDTLHIYKPHPAVYQLAVDRLGVKGDAISFQSSNAWDVHGAAVFGFRPVWINRFGAAVERLPGDPEHVMTDLTGLPNLLGA